MKKAFTLIEILAVIIILGIISMIIVPLVNVVVKNSKQQALDKTIETIETAAYNYSSSKELVDTGRKGIITLEELKENGNLENKDIINPVTNEILQGCVLYKWDSLHKQFEFNYSDECIINNLEILITNINGEFNSEGWAKEDFYVNVSTNNTAEKFKYCVSSSTCTPTTIVNSTNQAVLIGLESANTNVCAYSFNDEEIGETICEVYKLDKTNPIAGNINIAGTLGTNDWYISDVNITAINGSDSLSGHDTTTVNKNSIMENGSELVTVTTIDKAGNISTSDYTVKVDKTVPNVILSRSILNGEVILTAIVDPVATISGYTYTWYKDDNIVGGNTSDLVAPGAGIYKVKVTTGAGLSSVSNQETVSGYTITYNGNGGSNVSSQMKLQDIDINITSEIPTRTGYQFLGWAESATAKEAVYNSNDVYSLNSDKTLYAIWKRTLTVAFNANGAALNKTSDSCDIYNAEVSCSVTTPVITTQSGYTKLGFNLIATATEAIVDENSQLVLSNNGSIYYAVYYRTLTFNFNKNNAKSISKTSDSCTIYNKTESCTITTPTITAQSGYNVVGFGTSSSSTTATIGVSSNMTLNSANTGGTYYAIVSSINYCSSTSSYTVWNGTCTGTCGTGTEYGTIYYKSTIDSTVSCGSQSTSRSCNTGKSCTTTPVYVCDKGSGYTLNGTTCTKTVSPTCTTGTYKNGTCELSSSANSTSLCTTGTYNPTTNKCDVISTKSSQGNSLVCSIGVACGAYPQYPDHDHCIIYHGKAKCQNGYDMYKDGICKKIVEEQTHTGIPYGTPAYNQYKNDEHCEIESSDQYGSTFYCEEYVVTGGSPSCSSYTSKTGELIELYNGSGPNKENQFKKGDCLEYVERNVTINYICPSGYSASGVITSATICSKTTSSSSNSCSGTKVGGNCYTCSQGTYNSTSGNCVWTDSSKITYNCGVSGVSTTNGICSYQAKLDHYE